MCVMCVMCVVCVVYTDFPFVANSDVADELRIVPTFSVRKQAHFFDS